jgi:hypothetical protein
MKRTPLKRKTPLRKVSKKQAVKNSLYGKQRKEYLTQHPTCEICGAPATDVHHKSGRGAHTNDKSTFCALCRKCHDWLHFTADGKAWGYEHGYLGK